MVRFTVLIAAVALVGLMSCASAPEGPSIVLLGTAQDGGVPQIGCEEPLCRAARENAGRHRKIASLLIVDPRSGSRWLVDATPDLREQVEAARGLPSTRQEQGPRPPLFDGIFLTHAHVGHYAGLIHLGREAYGAERVPVHASARFRNFLETQGPWELLVKAGHIALHTLVPEGSVSLASDLSLTPLSVPHRDEYSDTFGFVIKGPKSTLLYIPDIDKWEKWDRRLEDEIAKVDVALLDGTFFADGEIPGRSMASIPHPFITETLAQLATLPPAERSKVRFTHLNHTNPALDPSSAAAQSIRAVGAAIAADGDVIHL